MDRQRAGSYRSRGRVQPEPQRSWFQDLKEWFRKAVAFLFGHVGICALVVGSIIMGAFAFMAIEANDDAQVYEEVMKLREDTVQRLWSITDKLNILDKDNWTAAVGDEVRTYQQQIVTAILDGYDGKNYTRPEADADGNPTGNQWSFSGAFLYCLTVITTIGNNNNQLPYIAHFPLHEHFELGKEERSKSLVHRRKSPKFRLRDKGMCNTRPLDNLVEDERDTSSEKWPREHNDLIDIHWISLVFGNDKGR